jgi:hypothetical protein
VHLKGLTILRVFLVYRTQVSDAGLVHLKRLTNLSALELDGTQVTDVRVKELKRALPSLRIIRLFDTRPSMLQPSLTHRQASGRPN